MDGTSLGVDSQTPLWLPAIMDSSLPTAPSTASFIPAPGTPDCRCSLLCWSSPMSPGPFAPQAKPLLPLLPSFPCQVCAPCPPLCLQHWLHGQQTPLFWGQVWAQGGLHPLGPGSRGWAGCEHPQAPTGAPTPFPNPPLNPTQGHPCFQLCPRGAEMRRVGLSMGDREGLAVAMLVWGLV